MFGIRNMENSGIASLLPGVYVTIISQQHTPFDYLNSLLSPYKNVCFIGLNSANDYFLNYSEASKLKLSNLLSTSTRDCYFLSQRDSKKSLVKLQNDLNKISYTQCSHVTIDIPKQLLLGLNHQDRVAFLVHLKSVSKRNKKVIQVIIHGYEHNSDDKTLYQQLVNRPDLIWGLSNLQPIAEQVYKLLSPFWITKHQVLANQSLDLQVTNEILLSDHDEDDHQNELATTDDENLIYIAKSAIESQQIPSKNMTIYADNQTLFSELSQLDSSQLNAATVIVSVYAQSEVRQLGVECYKLRRTTTDKIKIVIREMLPCLRYSDEMYFIQAGVNLVVPNVVQYTRFLTMLEMLQGQVLDRIIPSSVELLLNYNLENKQRGYVENQVFVDEVLSLITHYKQTQIKFALVELSLIQDIDIYNYLSMWNIKRSGDVITVCEGKIYLLLNSVRENNIDLVLSYIFKIPVADAFRSKKVYTSLNQISQQLPIILDTAYAVDPEKIEAIKQRSMPQQFAASSTHNVAEGVKVTFAQRKPLEI